VQTRPTAALIELSSCSDPATLQNLVAREALVKTTLALRRAIKAEKWPKPHQVPAIAFCALARDRCLIADEPGVGKEQPVDAPVLTPTGWQCIGHLRVGDTVIGSDGKPTRVTGVYPQGVKPVYRVIFSDRSAVEAGGEHLWLVRHWRGGKSEERLLLTTTEIRLRPVLHDRPHPCGGTTALDLSKTKLYMPMLSNPAQLVSPGGERPIGGYTIGQLIANGDLAHGHAAIVSAVPDWFHVQSRLIAEGADIRTTREYNNVVHANLCGISRHLRGLGVAVKSINKRIPPVYLCAPVEVRIALLHGLMDADGSCSKTGNRLTYHTSSMGLAMDVRALVECLGGTARVSSYDRSHEGGKGTDHVVRIRLPANVSPFSLPRKAGRYTPCSSTHPCRRVVNVEYTRDADCVCISVAAPDGIYVAAHAVLTHNTQPALLRILLMGHLPALVISPPNVLLNWKQEAQWWLPGVPVYRLDKVSRAVPPHGWPGVVVTTWDLVRHHVPALLRMRPRIVIADECHYALTPGTLRSDAFEAVARHAPHLLLLSGTPLVNRPKDLWRLLNLLDPAAWPEATLEGFKVMSDDAFDSGHQDRLTRRIRSYMLRRRKQEALTDLKAKTMRVVRVQLAEGDMAQYRGVEQGFAVWLDAKIRNDTDPADFESDEDYEEEVEARKKRALSSENLVKMGHLRRLVGQLKAPLAAAWLVEAARAREPVVAFADQPRVLARIGEILDRHGIRWGAIDGATTKTRRFSRVKEFQSGQLDVLLCTQAAREGITLHRARHVLRVERWWTDASEGQAADRVHRIGQLRDVTIWTMIAADTIDERMDRVVARKRRVTARTVDARVRLPGA